MTVYIVVNSYSSAGEAAKMDIVAVYDALEKAQAALRRCFEADSRWIREMENEIIEDILTNNYSSIEDSNYNFSSNWIITKEVL